MVTKVRLVWAAAVVVAILLTLAYGTVINTFFGTQTAQGYLLVGVIASGVLGLFWCMGRNVETGKKQIV